MQEHQSCTGGKNPFRFPRTSTREQDPDPSRPVPARSWPLSPGRAGPGGLERRLPQHIAPGSAEFPAPAGERIIPCLFALICF